LHGDSCSQSRRVPVTPRTGYLRQPRVLIAFCNAALTSYKQDSLFFVALPN
jgi:hypothetical protein